MGRGSLLHQGQDRNALHLFGPFDAHFYRPANEVGTVAAQHFHGLVDLSQQFIWYSDGYELGHVSLSVMKIPDGHIVSHSYTVVKP